MIGPLLLTIILMIFILQHYLDFRERKRIWRAISDLRAISFLIAVHHVAPKQGTPPGFLDKWAENPPQTKEDLMKAFPEAFGKGFEENEE